MKIQKIKAFSLVELIIVISILSILWTIWFISYNWYVSNARDSKRISDISLLKSSTLIYQKSHNWLLPDTINSNSWLIYSWSISNIISKQYYINRDFQAKLWISKELTDPKTNNSYIYSVSNDLQFFQYSATLEESNNIAYNYSNKTYADDTCWILTAYVDWNFIPSDLHVLPWLIYAFDYKNSNLDISLDSNLKKVVLNKQSINLAYDYSDNYKNCSWDIFSVNIWTNSWSSTTWLSCINSKWETIPHWTTEVIDLTWSSLNNQIWWKYKVCNNWVMDKNWVNAISDSDYYYACKDLWLWAIFDSTCHWTWCSNWYSINTTTPWCIANQEWVILASPQNWAYQIPTNAYLSWYPVKNLQNWTYKVYLWSLNNSFEIINWVSTTDTSMQFNWLSSWKMYFWKVQSCDLNWICKDSSVYSFTTSWDSNSSSSAWWNWNSISTYCPPWIICRADDVSISYVWCNSWNSSYNDCKKDDFWTSEKDWNDYFWVSKSIWYKITNNSDWIAKFKIFVWKTDLINSRSSTSYDDTNAINVNWNYIWNNFYWNAWEWCLWNSTSWYYVSAKTTCYINFYFRWDPLVSTNSSNIENVKIINIDTLNSNWTDTLINLIWKTIWYNQSILSINMDTTKYKNDLEPTLSTTSEDDFDISSLDSNYKWYWKALTYNIQNNNWSDAYFKPIFSNEFWIYNIAPLNSNLWSDSDFSTPWKNIDIWTNGIWNIYYNNGDFNLWNQCQTYKNWFKISSNSSCKITIFFRADQAISSIKNNIIDLKLADQAISNQNNIIVKNLYAKKSWWNTTLFTWYFPYSYNWWWLDFSTFQLVDDLTPTWFVRSYVMWWIDMSWSQTWSTIKIYYDSDKKRIKWTTYWQTAWWIDFNKTWDPNMQTYIDWSWSLHWWARSQNYWWISFDNWIKQ